MKVTAHVLIAAVVAALLIKCGYSMTWALVMAIPGLIDIGDPLPSLSNVNWKGFAGAGLVYLLFLGVNFVTGMHSWALMAVSAVGIPYSTIFKALGTDFDADEDGESVHLA